MVPGRKTGTMCIFAVKKSLNRRVFIHVVKIKNRVTRHGFVLQRV
jgi:hypothetical protein